MHRCTAIRYQLNLRTQRNWHNVLVMSVPGEASSFKYPAASEVTIKYGGNDDVGNDELAMPDSLPLL